MHSPVRRKMHGGLAFRVTSWVCALHLHRGLNFDNSDLVKSSILLNAVCLHEPNCTYSKRQDQVGRSWRRTKDLAVRFRDLHFFKRNYQWFKSFETEIHWTDSKTPQSVISVFLTVQNYFLWNWSRYVGFLDRGKTH